MAKAAAKRKRRFFTPEFKADAVKIVRAGGKSVPEVAQGRSGAQRAAGRGLTEEAARSAPRGGGSRKKRRAARRGEGAHAVP